VQPARHEGYGAEDLGSRAGEGIGHGGAIAESHGGDELLIDAEISLQVLDVLVIEGYIFAALVTPALVQAVGGDEDDAVVMVEGLQAVVWGATRIYTLEVHIKPMLAEHQLIGHTDIRRGKPG